MKYLVVNWIPLSTRRGAFVRETPNPTSNKILKFSLRFTPVAGSIFRPLSQIHISKRVFMNEISSPALLDIQLTLLGVCGFISPRIRTFVEERFTVSFPKTRIRNLGVFLCF